MVFSANVRVLIVNFRSSHLVAELLASLPAGSYTSVHILDNSPSDSGEYSRLEALAEEMPDTSVYTSGENLGFGGGVNRLFELVAPSDGDIIWVLNPDVEYSRGSVEGAVRRILDGEADVISPLILMPSSAGDLVWFGGGDIEVSIGRFTHVDYGAPASEIVADTLTITSCVTGAAPMMRAGLYRQLGGFDESLFLYWEDVDLSLRATAEGFRLGIANGLVISHDEGRTSGSSGEHSAVYYQYMAQNRIVVCGRHGASIWSLLVGGGFLETLRSCVIRPLREKSGRITKLRASIHGLLAGALRVRDSKKAAARRP